jgi:predicted kinase
MVLEALVRSEQWQALAPIDRGVLFWAALLHDIAKSACTRTDPDGRIQSPNHTIKGESMARQILYKGIPEPVPFLQREQIVKLVRFHGMPRWLMEQDDSLKRIIRASQVVNLKYLALLAQADARGRISPDIEDSQERVRLFAQYASEAGCYDRPYPFKTNLARITYLNSDNGSPAYVPYDTTWGQVILMSGLPGAGKDTWIRSQAQHLPMVSLDEIRAELCIGPEQNQGRVIQEAKARAKALLRTKSPFVWNATNITSHIRKPLIDIFLSYGARVKIVYVEPHYADLIRQNKDRRDAVPVPVIDKLIAKLEVPTMIEANEVQYICPG